MITTITAAPRADIVSLSEIPVGHLFRFSESPSTVYMRTTGGAVYLKTGVFYKDSQLSSELCGDPPKKFVKMTGTLEVTDVQQ